MDSMLTNDIITNLPAMITSVTTGVASVLAVLFSHFSTSKRQNAQLMKINQLLLHDEHLPIRERINAGEEYIKFGGNGASKVYLEELKKRYREELQKGGFV